MTRSKLCVICTTLVVALVLFGHWATTVRAGGVDGWAEEREWSVVPQPESNQGGVQRDGTLRVIRFGLDGQDPLTDQGTVVGWVNRAASGTLVEHKEEGPVDALLEIVRRMPTGTSK